MINAATLLVIAILLAKEAIAKNNVHRVARVADKSEAKYTL